MRDLSITVSNRSPQTITTDAGFVEEIGATRLVITLGGEIAENDIDYYVLDFELPSPLRRVKSCRIYTNEEEPGEQEAYIDDGVIYCTLWQELTNAPRIRFQIEAYRLDSNDEIKSVTRSGVVTINLLQGISGEEGTSDTGVHGLVAEIQHLENSLSTLSENATYLYNQTTDTLSNIVEEVGNNIDIHIGDNGHWFFGNEDLGIQAQGEKGDTGETGAAGADGADGADGVDGTDGINAYVHIRYGTSATPSELLTEPNDYMGIYSGSSETAPTTYSSYKWYKIKGEQGLAGNDGSDGTDGSDGDDGKSLEYNWSGTSLGVRVEGDANYTYVNLKGDTGATGASGNDGQDGTDGTDGVSPTVTVNTNTSAEYKLSITDKNGTIITPNLKGTAGIYVSSAGLTNSNLVLTMSDSSTVEADMSGLVSGMATQTWVGQQGYQTASDVSTAISGKADSSSLATVATSGSYSDLSNKPTIPTAVSDLTNDSGYQTASDVSTAISGKADSSSLATVATSGSYSDLSNKPTIPTAVSDLTNDSGFATQTYVNGLVGNVETLLQALR